MWAYSLNIFQVRQLVLYAQGYIVAFHSGGMMVHKLVGHHPAASVGPGVFVLLALLVMWLRMDLVTASSVGIFCAFWGSALSWLMVKRKDAGVALLGGDHGGWTM